MLEYKIEPERSRVSPQTEAAKSKRNPGDQALPGTPQSGEALCYACRGSGVNEGKHCVTCGGSGKIIQLIGEA